MTQRLDERIRSNLDQLLIVPGNEFVSTFEKVKAPPGTVGVKSIQKEIEKLQTLRATGITEGHLMNIPFKVQSACGRTRQLLFRRAKNETASEMRSHPDFIRYGLMACFIHLRMMEVIDSIVTLFVAIIHRIDVRAEEKRDKELLAEGLRSHGTANEVKRVDGKTQLLFRVAEAVVDNPDGTIRDVIFPKVKEETFKALVAEKEVSGPQYQLLDQRFMKQKYNHHYLRILPLVLEHIKFKSDNRFQPIIEALAIIKRYLGTSYKYFPVSVPIEGIVTGSWSFTVLEQVGKQTRINRKYYELCVLQQLERACAGGLATRKHREDARKFGSKALTNGAIPVRISHKIGEMKRGEQVTIKD